jgi:hypothetical protein
LKPKREANSSGELSPIILAYYSAVLALPLYSPISVPVKPLKLLVNVAIAYFLSVSSVILLKA